VRSAGRAARAPPCRSPPCTVRASAGVVALLITLALPGAASAQAVKTVRLDGGQTRIGSSVLRVTAGYVDPKTGEGRVEHRGVLRTRGKSLRNPVIDTRRLRPRRARSNALVTHVAGISRRFGIVRMRLVAGQLLFTGGATTLTLDAAFIDVLARLGIEVGGTTLRIVGGRLDASTLEGELAHDGDLVLTRGAAVVPLEEPALEFGRFPVLTAVIGDFRPPLATLTTTGRTREIEGRTATIGNLVARLETVAASRLNTRFETDAFHPGLTLGTLAIRGRLRG
ncbi:MAG TPA: hypothetical protein VGW10_18615, partial [Solirubrobacteraceae bacterium]|nr:hypothetical protein [Solirubrobacteraceae bacterium]